MKTKKSTRKKVIFGSVERPRLSVFRSASHIYAQIIDDDAGKTLAAVSSLKMKKGGNREAAKQVGKAIAAAAAAKGIKKVIFDRGRFQYIGRIKNVADGAREGGLVF
ncbi:MAG: 50S ribosomal protein L18 [Candidatus Margulisbacteria bacterium]|nr:50S ribosomal protein L18 [Candidatus Margulisiibacteriota bacterium]